MINEKARVELEEVIALGSETFCVIDSERKSEKAKVSGKRIKFQKICEQLGIPCLVLERRATENYLTADAIRAVKGDQ